MPTSQVIAELGNPPIEADSAYGNARLRMSLRGAPRIFAPLARSPTVFRSACWEGPRSRRSRTSVTAGLRTRTRHARAVLTLDVCDEQAGVDELPGGCHRPGRCPTMAGECPGLGPSPARPDARQSRHESTADSGFPFPAGPRQPPGGLRRLRNRALRRLASVLWGGPEGGISVQAVCAS